MPEVAGDGMKGCTLLVVVHRKPFPFFRKFPLTDHYRSSGSLGPFLDRNPTNKKSKERRHERKHFVQVHSLCTHQNYFHKIPLTEYLFETIYQPIMVAITVLHF